MSTENDSFKPEHIDATTEFDKLTIGQFIPRLRVGQLLAVIGVIAGLICGAYILGYKTSSSVTDAELSAMQVKVDTISAKLQKRFDAEKAQLAIELQTARIDSKERETEFASQKGALTSDLLDKERKLTAVSTALAKETAELGRYRRKDRFISLFLQYRQNLNDANRRRALNDYITRLIQDSEAERSVVRAAKGQETIITFWDGSRWIVPTVLAAGVDT